MIKALIELGRSAGHKVEKVDNVVTDIVSGRAVTLKKNALTGEVNIVPANGAEAGFIYGFAADDTKAFRYNGMYDQIDGNYKFGLVAAFLFGGHYLVWDDSRGPVFEFDGEGSVLNAEIGTKLYIDAEGKLTVKAGNEGTMGAECVGYVLTAPATQNDALEFKAIK